MVEATVLLSVLRHLGITNNKLGYFILDNVSNNDKTLTKLAKSMKFLPKERRLYYMGHILNLITEQYLLAKMPRLLKGIIKQQETFSGDNFGDSKESLESYAIWYNTF